MGLDAAALMSDGFFRELRARDGWGGDRQRVHSSPRDKNEPHPPRFHGLSAAMAAQEKSRVAIARGGHGSSAGSRHASFYGVNSRSKHGSKVVVPANGRFEGELPCPGAVFRHCPVVEHYAPAAASGGEAANIPVLGKAGRRSERAASAPPGDYGASTRLAPAKRTN